MGCLHILSNVLGEDPTYLMVGLTSILLLAAEFGVVYMIKPRKLSNLLFIHAYWFS